MFVDITTNGGSLLLWHPAGIRDGLVVKKGRWTAATAPKTASRLLDGVYSAGGTIRYGDDTYGSFAAIKGDKSTDRITAWNTAPTLEAIHYGQDADFIYVSNRPITIAIAMAAVSRRQIRTSRDYLLEYINFGFSVSGCTPFDGVRVLPPRTALSIGSGRLQLIAAPVGHETTLESNEDPRRTGTAELVTALRESTARLLDSQPKDEIQLRLSGGVDSRLLLGLLKEHPVENITAVCQGGADSEEVMVAAQLAALAGIELIVKTPELIDPSGFVDSMRQSIGEAQGLIPSEALVSPYAVADPMNVGESLAAGQWPLFKGVLERTANNALEAAWHLLLDRSASVLSPRHNRDSERAIQDWAASVPAFTNLELLYMYGRDIRSSRYLQPHATQLDREAEVLYPYVDSQVTAVADALPIMNRMRQITAFLAIQEIWPEALQVPLANDGRFRFEATGPLEGISGDHYLERTAKPEPYTGPVDDTAFDAAKDRDFFASPISSASRYVTTSPRWRELRRYLAPEFRGIVEQAAKYQEKSARGLAPSDKSPRWLQLMTWRLVLADLWLEGDWVPKIRR
ncbi:asparagine synthetase B family protein [Gulosibacter chungangensis]|uniref:Asparagine synthase n=1 Tax=Gulosibacter chungangensis TaxID=979746 RepID=A0A7J5B7M6_9MICO|nr:hypothetical protein [Gulosibacter chungangensis]KAB1640826.1 hypothetical protein F8O05_14090 [Gulosibacter chungangensis]